MLYKQDPIHCQLNVELPVRYCDDIPGTILLPHTLRSLHNVIQYEGHIDHLWAIDPSASLWHG